MMVLVLVTLGATSVVAGAGVGDGASAASGDTEAKQIGQVHFEISNEQMTVSDIHVSGSGLPSMDIQERTYTVHNASLMTDGFTVTLNGQDYEFGSVSIVVEDVSLTVENVQVGSE